MFSNYHKYQGIKRQVFYEPMIIHTFTNHAGAVVDVIVWQLDLQLPMQSVPITTDVVSSNLDQSDVYNIMW